MPLLEKDRRARDRRRSGYAVFETGGGIVHKRRARIRLFAYVVLLAMLVALGGAGYLFWAVLDETEGEPSEQQQAALEQEAPKETAAEEEEAQSAAPEDPTLYLTVPRLGIHEHTVRNDRSEEALGAGAIKLPGTGFPWQKGDTNTYIACHRLGFPGTESHNQCLHLPSMRQGDEVTLKDTKGRTYSYRVSEVFAVGPNDAWVTKPVEDRDVVTLQTCTESVDDWVSLGPRLIESGPGSGRLIVRATGSSSSLPKPTSPLRRS